MFDNNFSVHYRLSNARNTAQQAGPLKVISMVKPLFNAVGRASRAPRCSIWIGIYLAIALMISGCAGVFSPRPIDEIPFKVRAEKQTQGNLTVTAALPTRREARDIYGIDLGVKDMQPVWIEVKNEEAVPYWFLPSGLDPT